MKLNLELEQAVVLTSHTTKAPNATPTQAHVPLITTTLSGIPLRVKHQPYDHAMTSRRHPIRNMEKDVFSRDAITLLAPRSHGLKFIMIAAILILGTICLLDPGKQWPQKMSKMNGKKVPLEAHIM